MARKQQYDAIIVGSGPAGGWAAKALTEAGMEVLVLEAGQSKRRMDVRHLYQRMMRRAGYRVDEDKAILNRQPVQSRCYAWSDHPRAFVDDVDNPYTTAACKPFAWIRSRQEGGRMLVPRNGLEFYRFSDLDFKAATRDGFGDDWPITYDELAPYYDRVERFIGLSGNTDDIAHLPNPVVTRVTALSAADRKLRSALINRWPERGLITRRTSSHAPFPVRSAAATGRLFLRHEAVARKIALDERTGLVNGVCWFEDGIEHHAKARVVILAASSIESARLLLNSRTGSSGHGLANSSGTVGCYLMDHTSVSGFTASIPLPRAQLSSNTSYTYLPQFRNVATQCSDFLRGYGTQIWTLGATCGLTVRGEMLPRQSNRVTIDPNLKDRWGIPAVKIDCTPSANEHAQMRDAILSTEEMLNEAGFLQGDSKARVDTLGMSIHECGTARMGWDAKTSVLNRYNQSWDVKNLFVVDASCFVSQGVQNPTLTIMALALRAAENIVSLMKRREI